MDACKTISDFLTVEDARKMIEAVNRFEERRAREEEEKEKARVQAELDSRNGSDSNGDQIKVAEEGVETISLPTEVDSEKEEEEKEVEEEKEEEKTEMDMVNQNFAKIISILEERVMGDSAQLNDQRVKMLRRELTTKKKTIRFLETQNRHLEKEMKNQEEIFRLKEANLHMALDGKNQLVGKFGTDVSDYVKELIQEKNGLEERVEKFEDQEEEYQEEIEKLKEELRAEKEKNKTLAETLAEKEEELAEIEESMEVEEEKMEALQKEVDESRGRIQGLKDLTSLKLVASFDVSQIEQIVSMINATQPPTPQPQPAQGSQARTAKCRGIYSEVLAESPDAPQLMQLGDLVDLIWKGTDRDQIKRILHNLREHQKYKDLDGWSNTEELEKLLAEKAAQMEQGVLVSGTVTEVISRDSGLLDF